MIQRPPSARQKMINLMYIVLLAMLAMNVSSDVLNGFKIVEESLSKSTTNATIQNEQAYRQFATADSINHEKVGEWYGKALYVKQISDSLFNFADELKRLIAIEADGRDARQPHRSCSTPHAAREVCCMMPSTTTGKGFLRW